MLVGGSPRRVLKLSDRGARIARDLLSGVPVTDTAGAALARRLLSAGLAHPVPSGSLSDDIQVVIPAYGATHLDDCLRSLGDELPIHVIDDGSADGAEVAAVAERHGARLTRSEPNRGPAAARNIGLRAASRPVVAFVDSDALVTTDALRRLASYLADPQVAAVAPRVQPRRTDASTVLARFAMLRSPLDLGSRPARVHAAGRVGHVPATVLVVRRGAVEQLDGFDESLRVGEDVDLVWRLAEAGYDVRYQPDVAAAHVEPASWSAWLRRRASYGTSAGSLDVREPVAAVALRPPALPVMAVALFAGRRDRLAVGCVALAVAQQWSHWRRSELPMSSVAPAIARDTVSGVVASSRWISQIWWPLFLVLSRGRRRRAFAVLALPALVDWLVRRPSVDPMRWAGACIADDVAYGAGVWRGCLRGRTWRPVVTRAIRRRNVDAAASAHARTSESESG